MKDFSTEVIQLINKIRDAGQIIIYGAKQRAKDILPVCEAFAEKNSIQAAVTSRGGVKQFLGGIEVQEIDEININSHTLVLVAMDECRFHKIRQMSLLNAAGSIIYLNMPLIIEARRYAVFKMFEKSGIDLRLLDNIQVGDIIRREAPRQYYNITAKSWEIAAEETARYVFANAAAYHAWLKEQIRKNQTEKGINMEFGVAGGSSLWKLADEDMNIFYGFDSFEGLPEDWFWDYEKGAFKENGIPEVPDHVELVKGWYDTVLPVFSGRNDMIGRRADFIHIDCDLYTSTKTIFDNMDRFIKKGTIIAFDEYFNYPGWQLDEYRAFQEYVSSKELKYEYLAYVENGSQVCVRIL